jgi:hypothetical protein
MSDDDRRPRESEPRPEGGRRLGAAAAAAAGAVLALLAVLAVVILIGDRGDDERASAPPADRTIPQRPVPQGPSEKARPAPAGAERVIRAWTEAIRQADFRKAAGLFAVPARVQNGGPPRTLDNPALVIAWNATLPCGAKVTRVTGGPGGFAVTEFELTDRKGSSCGSGVGAPAASAIKVEDGHITEWYRLPDGPPPPGEPVRPEAPEDPGLQT